ncbi:putative quinol monooxygenase [Sphingomonas jatrophae]|uniref:Quinol monooxygenase YgiN n=1 Tax=Sphingomonas jatrophae TaxID=1166337 RepID=A0A1I6M1R8_9SPHN|nr:putative quinol monooxygenase [Sphingomonas jatrophae]SFS09656.1 Quinol monooxygenase YgiN [Sphingomonas jatrophae]
MIILAGHIRTTPDQVEGLAQALRSLVPATLAEDGCLAYAFALDDREVGTVLVYERWRDQAALDAHLALPEVLGILTDWGDKVTIDVRKFDAANERSPLD